MERKRKTVILSALIIIILLISITVYFTLNRNENIELTDNTIIFKNNKKMKINKNQEAYISGDGDYVFVIDLGYEEVKNVNIYDGNGDIFKTSSKDKNIPTWPYFFKNSHSGVSELGYGINILNFFNNDFKIIKSEQINVEFSQIKLTKNKVYILTSPILNKSQIIIYDKQGNIIRNKEYNNISSIGHLKISNYENTIIFDIWDLSGKSNIIVMDKNLNEINIFKVKTNKGYHNFTLSPNGEYTIIEDGEYLNLFKTKTGEKLWSKKIKNTPRYQGGEIIVTKDKIISITGYDIQQIIVFDFNGKELIQRKAHIMKDYRNKFMIKETGNKVKIKTKEGEIII